MSSDLYNSSTFFFSYSAKSLLHDSVTRTSDGYGLIVQTRILKGIAHILLARIECAGAFAAALSAIL